MKKCLKFVALLSVCLIFLQSCNQEQKKAKKSLQPKDVKIIATLGKEGWKNIPDFCESGANIFRINGSHIKSEEQLKKMLEEVNKQIQDKKCKNIEVMYDTQGPEIRTIILEKKQEVVVENKKDKKTTKKDKNKKSNKNNTKDKKTNNKNEKSVKKEEIKIIKNNPASYEIQKNDKIIVHTNLSDEEVFYNGDIVRDNNSQKTIHIGINYKDFINDVSNNMTLTIENRLIYAKVDGIDKEKGLVKLVITEINTKDGKYNLTDRRHINLIGEPVSLPTLTENDKEYIKISALAGVKYYAISFVRNGKDINEVRNIIRDAYKEKANEMKVNENTIDNEMKNVKIIAKIETKQGLDNLTEIVQASEGAMVARGDLASEIPMEAVPYAKYKIIKKCNKFGKFSILATDVLQSMMTQEAPSRNDVDVVITALQLGVDSLMLSNETAQGDKGVKSIKEMKKLIDFDNNFKIKKLQQQKEKNKKE